MAMKKLYPEPHIAYFSMEIGIDAHIPTYSGGLGVLAGDTLRSCADLGVPIVGVTLLSEKGYFFQRLDDEGNQIEMPVEWSTDDFLRLLPTQVSVPIEGREVRIRPWEYVITGINGHQVPVYFLDTNIPENDPSDRQITSFLYGGDHRYRLCQEIILGIGGTRMIEALDYKSIQKYHMNEGHAALLILELSKQSKNDMELVREKCVFTTHTPVPAGHDRFPKSLVRSLLGGYLSDEEIDRISPGDELNMTRLALDHSTYINGVARRHGEISRNMFPGYPIDSITNGVHHIFWTCESFRELFDRHISGWRTDPFALRSGLAIPREEIWAAHFEAKKKLIDLVNQRENAGMDYDSFTLGFARRATQYKRPDLLFADIQRLIDIVAKCGPIQIVYAGKAHPNDWQGKEAIKHIFNAMKGLKGHIRMAYLQNYDIDLARLIVAGVDVWLNNPRKPYEASGTSGMKACLNGIPSLSVLDGWWMEGHIENVTGWAIGARLVDPEKPSDHSRDIDDLYDKLEKVVVPMYYGNRDAWIQIMQHCIAINASFFNSHRMVQQYVLNAYFI